MTGYPRDLVGYADQPPDPRWPGGAPVGQIAMVRRAGALTGCEANHRGYELAQGAGFGAERARSRSTTSGNYDQRGAS